MVQAPSTQLVEHDFLGFLSVKPKDPIRNMALCIMVHFIAVRNQKKPKN